MQVNVIIHPYGSAANPGFVSPDFSFTEAKFTRKLAMYVKGKLDSTHIHAELTVQPYDFTTECSVDFAVAKAVKVKMEDQKSVTILLALRLSSNADNGLWTRNDTVTVRADEENPESYVLKGFIEREYMSTAKMPTTCHLSVWDTEIWKSRCTKDVNALIEGCRQTGIIPVVVGNFLIDRKERMMYMSTEKGLEDISDGIVKGITEYLNSRYGESRNVKYRTNFKCPALDTSHPEKYFMNWGMSNREVNSKFESMYAGINKENNDDK